MSVVQAVYGVTDTGWKLTDADGKLSAKAEQLLKEVAAVSAAAYEMFALDYADGLYLYSRTVRCGVDSVGRPAQLTHGYFFTKEELEGAPSMFEQMLGIDGFVSSCDAKVTPLKELPTRERCRKAEVKLDALLAVFCQAVIEKKGLDIVVTDPESAKGILSVLASSLPAVFKRFLTFSLGESSRKRKITFTAVRGSSGLYYDAETGFSNGSEPYLSFAAELAGAKDAVKALEEFAATSAKRLESDYEIAAETFEKWMITKGNFGYFAEAPIELFARLTRDERHTDPVYRVLLRKVLQDLTEREQDVRNYYGKIVESLLRCADAQDRETDGEAVLFLLKSYLRYGVAPLVGLFADLRKKSSLHKCAVSVLLKDEQFYAILTEYLNLYFTVSSFRTEEDLSAKEYQALAARLLDAADAPQLERERILDVLFEIDPKNAKRFEEALCKKGFASVVEAVYLTRFKEWGTSRTKLFALYERLKALGVDSAAFASASWNDFRGFCIAEHELGLLSAEEANALLKAYAAAAGADAPVIAQPEEEKKKSKARKKKGSAPTKKSAKRQKTRGVWERIGNSPAFLFGRFGLVTAAVLAATAPLAYCPLSAYLQGVIDALTASLLAGFALWDTMRKRNAGPWWVRPLIGLLLWMVRVAVYVFTLWHI